MEQRAIVIGGGTAGCLIAAYLSKDRPVHLVERGGIPLDFSLMLNGDFNTAQIFNYSTVDLTAVVGEGLGGCSSVNGSVWVHHIDSPWLKKFNIADAMKKCWAEMEGNVVPIKSFNETDQRLRSFIARMAEIFSITQFQEASTTAIEGIFPLPLSCDGTLRVSSYTAFLKGNSCTNLTVNTETTIDKILFKKVGDKDEATDIITSNGKTIPVGKAEVILSAGTFGSCHILLKSGLEMPGLGQNLQDHVCISFSTGLPSIPSCCLYAAFFKSSSRELLPDFQIQFGYGAPKGRPGGFLFQVVHLKSNAVGYIEKSNSFFPNGKFDCKNKQDDEKWLTVFSKLERLFEKFPDLCKNWKERLSLDLRNSYLHPVGTCSIGSVVDPISFLVNGTTNVRVCDASVIPESTIGNPQAYVFALAAHFVNCMRK